MKKIIALMLALVMVMMTTASCGGEETTTSLDVTTTSAQATQSTTKMPDGTTGGTEVTDGTIASSQATTATTETTTVPTEPELDPEDFLVLHLDFDEWDIDTNVITDITGNGHDGTAYGRVDIVDGPDGYGDAAGFGNVGDYVKIANSVDLNFSSTDSFTVNFWYKLDAELFSHNTWPCLFTKGIPGTTSYYGVWITQSKGYSGVNCGMGTQGSANVNTTATSDLAAGEWHHYVAVYDGEKGLLTTYVDGVAGKSATKTFDVTSDADLFIGITGVMDAMQQFFGAIDEFKIYSCAIDSATIQGIEETEDELVAHWDFNEISTGGTVADLSGKEHTGIVTGNVEIVEAKDGNGAKFAGDGAVITVADAEDLNFLSGQSFTLEITFKADTGRSTWGALVQKGLADKAAPYYGFWIDNTDKLNLGAAAKGTKNYASNSELGGEYHHAVMIQNAEAGTVLFYLDGVLQSSTQPKNASAPLKPVYLVSEGEALTIGTNGFDHFSGIIDDIKIYNYAVDESELLADYGTVNAMAREEYKYVDSETGEKMTLPYRVHLPEGYDENDGKTYPILIVLHGHGETGYDNAGQLRIWGGCVQDIYSREDFIVIIPQCPCDNGLNREWISSEHHFDNVNRELPKKATLALSAVVALMNEYIDSGKVNTDRVYAMGSSMGACGIWELMTREPEMFTAALLMCGAGIPSEAANLVDIDIWAFHGTADETIPVEGTKNMEKAIKAAGGTKMKATYLEGVDHNCMNYCFEEGDILGWLISQTKTD